VLSIHSVVKSDIGIPLMLGGSKLLTILHAGDEDVLPLLSRAHLQEAFLRVPPRQIQSVLQHHVVPVAWLPGQILYGFCGQRGFDFARDNKLKLVAEISPSDFHPEIRSVWGKKLRDSATFRLSRRLPAFSARQRLTPAQIIFLAACLAGTIVALTMLSPVVLWSFASMIVGLFFLSVIMLRLFCVLPRFAKKTVEMQRVSDDDLPRYSVLVPVFHEENILGKLIWALKNLDYPHEKLDIKIVTEEHDTALRRALEQHDLPKHFEIIVVPPGKPQTKPRALNYALQFCQGDLLTIFDAEDIPHSQQLRDAAHCFMTTDDSNLACVQAQLVFFNSRENWLTRQFTAEYATLFGVVLPALAAHGLPLPLGGTSNHFRTDILRRIGGWDAFNVTEDADLGFRLARFGFTTGVVDSITREEANTQYANWLKQRARWLKGFLQTWLVHMRNPIKTKRALGLGGFWVLQACTIGVFASALLHPLLLILTICQLYVYPPFSPGEPSFVTAVNGLNLFIFILGYGVSMYAANKALRLRGRRNWWGTIATMPVYWFLMSAAGWLALYQFILAPFEWNKTEHGLSRKADSA
jgi:glycosyltransferase XagB